MKPVDQTHFGKKRPEEPAGGNCFLACVASVCELPLETIPDFNVDEERWWDAFCAWADENGYDVLFTLEPLPGYTIVGGKVTRSDQYHACVALDGVIVHDPNPCRAGLIAIRDYIKLFPRQGPRT